MAAGSPARPETQEVAQLVGILSMPPGDRILEHREFAAALLHYWLHDDLRHQENEIQQKQQKGLQ